MYAVPESALPYSRLVERLGCGDRYLGSPGLGHGNVRLLRLCRLFRRAFRASGVGGGVFGVAL